MMNFQVFLTRLVSSSALMLVISCCVGCPSKSSQSSTQEAPSVSDVALRVLVIGEVEDEELVARQWLAGSEQDVTIRAQSASQILEEERLHADVVLFPSWMLIELIERDMLMKLSVPDPATVDEDSDDMQSFTMTSAEKAQASFDGDLYALSLGISLPAVVASDALGQKLASYDGELTWSTVLAARQQAEMDEFNFAKADLEALLDRYLALVAMTTKKNPTFGILFELETMKPRLTKPEFVEAAEILKQLARQPDGLLGLLSSHERTWDWVTSHEAAVVAIASPCAVTSSDVAKATNGRLLKLKAASANGVWNVGGGMLVGLSDDCSQTRRAMEMVTWFGRTETRTALAPIIPGLQATSPITGSDSLAWTAQQQLSTELSNRDIPREPSLPNGNAYRQALAKELLLMIQEDRSPEDALSDANAAWEKLVEEAGQTLKFKYEKSLNITL